MSVSGTNTSIDWFVCFMASAGLLCIIMVRRWHAPTWAPPFPPGPPGYPFLGNLFDIPPQDEWKTYAEWSRKYQSDVISVNILGSHITILNSSEAVHDLLEERSTIYSGRPGYQMTMVRELMDWGWATSVLDYSNPWRLARKLMHQEFHPDASLHHPHMLRATVRLLQCLLENPNEYMSHLRQMAGETIMSVTYGIDILPKNDPHVEIAEKALQGFSLATNAGSFIVDSLPILKYVPSWTPGADFKKTAEYYKPWAQLVRTKPFDEVKRRMEDGSARPSFVSSCLSRTDDTMHETVYQSGVRDTAGTMYAAGADTTVSSISTAILGLLSNPAALVEAQKQIDAVVGKNRLPDFSDMDQLPWVTAIVREAMRWQPVTPLAIPHKVSVDDRYNGFHLPAHSVVVGNTWAILHNEKTYPDPMSFKPERFMMNGVLNPAVTDPATAAFGFGRRICPGRFFAISAVWISVANLLAVFDISKVKDNDGNVTEPTYEYTSGFLCYPKPFPCSIAPRNENSARLIQDQDVDNMIST